jgi:hypothetical protein
MEDFLQVEDRYMVTIFLVLVIMFTKAGKLRDRGSKGSGLFISSHLPKKDRVKERFIARPE